MRAALHAIDDVFRPLEHDDPIHRKEPASVKKMLKGDAYWSQQKRLLGWEVDSLSSTLNLPPHRVARLREVLAWLQPPRTRLSRRKWHQLVGELRSMSPALPGTRGLFSVLQAALSKGDATRVRLNRHIYDTAADFTFLVDSLAARLTRLQELVPTHPSHIGACDACQVGMGGVWLSSFDTTSPIVWRHRFPAHVASSLVTADNPKGLVSISDLELAGIIAHKDVLAHDIRERTIWIASDNRAAVSWATKGSATSLAARAYLFLYNALHQRQFSYLARHHFIAGPVNAMADDASRLWHLSDTALLTHFDSVYPQTSSWQLHHLLLATNSALTGALCRQRPSNESLDNVTPLPLPAGTFGNSSALPSISIHSPSLLPTSSLYCNFSPSATAPVPARPAVSLSDLGQWRTPYKRWVRRTPGWGPLTLG
jgi:hypothetical protein